jgi:integrase
MRVEKIEKGMVVSETAGIEPIAEQVMGYAAKSRSESTRKAYRTDWDGFFSWCLERRLDPLPASPSTVAAFLAAKAGEYKTTTLNRKLAAISVVHKSTGHPSPTGDELVRATLAGIGNEHGTRKRRVAPVRVDHLRIGFTGEETSPQAIRDRALVLLGYAGAFRRSELVALDVSDVRVVREGLQVTVRRSKTDQSGEGFVKGIPFGSRIATCPVRAVSEYMARFGIEEGALFRPVTRGGALRDRRLTPESVAVIIKRLASSLGLDPSEVSGHSLRAGLITDGAASGVSETVIMAHTGHKTSSVLRGYYREGNLFRSNVAAQVGL